MSLLMDALKRAEQAREAKAAEEAASSVQRAPHPRGDETSPSIADETSASLGGATDEGGLSDTGIDLSSDSGDLYTADPPTLDELASSDQLFLEPIDEPEIGPDPQSTGTWPSGGGSLDDAASRDFLLGGGDTGATMPSYRSVRSDLDEYFADPDETSPSLGDDTAGNTLSGDTLDSATSGDSTFGDATRRAGFAEPGLDGANDTTGGYGATSERATTSGGSGWADTAARSRARFGADGPATGSGIDTGSGLSDVATAAPLAAGSLFVPRRPRRRSASWVTLALVPTLVLGVVAAGGYAYWDDLVKSFVKGPTLVVDRSPPRRGTEPTARTGGDRPAQALTPTPSGEGVTDTTSASSSAGQASAVSGSISAATGTNSVASTATSSSTTQSSASGAGGASSSSAVSGRTPERAPKPVDEAFTQQSVAIGTLIAAGSRSREIQPEPGKTSDSGASQALTTPSAEREFTAPFPPAAPRVGVGRVATSRSSSPGGVRISRRAKPSRVNPYVSRGYEAYQDGNLEAARAAYGEALSSEPRNRDALLGLAAIALREGKPREAAGGYHTLLRINPRDEAARAGLLAVEGSTDGASQEGQVREMLRTAPDSAALHANLGGLYSQQGRWPEAQQAYFDAYRLDSENADNAYNLAVSLDQLAQGQAALNYYRRALELSGRAGARFDNAAVTSRINALAAQ